MGNYQERLSETRKKEEKVLERRQKKELERRRRVIRITEQPVLPGLCRSLYRLMFVMTGIAATAELIASIRNRELADFLSLLSSAMTSILTVYLVLATALVVLSAVQLIRIKHGYKEMKYFFLEEIPKGMHPMELETVFDEDRVPEEKLQLYRMPAGDAAAASYRKYIWTALIGSAVLGLIGLFVIR